MDESSTPRSEDQPLKLLRDQIDSLDHKLIELINERASLVVEVGKIKRDKGIPIYAPHREAQVLEKALKLNRGPIPDRTLEAIFREMMSGSFALEQPLRIGYLGPMGTYSHLAAISHFGSSVEFEDLRAIEGVFEEVARGHVNYGLVPIENSTGGGITDTLDAFKVYHAQLSIYGEVQLAVHSCLLANCQPQEVKRIYSKPEAFSQCRNWLITQYPHAELIPAESTAAAVKKAKLENEKHVDAGAAAIGSSLAGEIHGMHPLFENIEDRQHNITRFLILAKCEAEISGDDKTSLMFTTDDRPGSLVDVLNVFKRANINLTHIDKRPSREVNWDYTFFIDALGHRKDLRFAEVVGEARAYCKQLVVLGSYPRSTRVL
ncbi:MAG TPA: prephenate dehydratase [Pirellulaceae bacterium]|nr:prephenate dehydratase [Pirellulaceae bacterium]HMO90796.1 prephenate dehydratase [Pirellulaceae bacterium]HMP68047.1 prephenate dehydratase [Pirellulaceae bacterium]